MACTDLQGSKLFVIQLMVDSLGLFRAGKKRIKVASENITFSQHQKMQGL